MLDAKDTNDQSLISAIGNGDSNALGQLYLRWAPKISRIIRQIGVSPDDIPDILQEIFFEIWKKAGRYNPNRGSVYSWIFQLSRNRTIDFLRHHRRNDSLIESAFSEDAQSDLGDRLFLDQALSQLRPVEQKVLELAYFGGYTQKEIAQAWNVPVGSVKTWGHRGLEKLRRWMKKGGEKW